MPAALHISYVSNHLLQIAAVEPKVRRPAGRALPTPPLPQLFLHFPALEKGVQSVCEDLDNASGRAESLAAQMAPTREQEKG